ncbi:MAG: ABC transporter ATP-binding protein [Acidobacteriota bacterium]|nr:MAG: ABC transporter ATP-binding protein [Acidobacteriota bacterium]
MNAIAIRGRGLVKRFDDVIAVDGLDLEVRSGECFGLLGPNGAGKTTTVEMLEGLQSPTAGEIEILGRRWDRQATRLRQRLGIQLQQSEFQDKLTVLETVRLFRSFYERGWSAEQAIQTVSLQEKARAYVRKLSGGQKQRLSLACALVGEPEILFLDEPTTGLDPQSRLRIWDVVAAFRQRGGTVLLTTHYMEEAERLCDRVAIIDRGKVIALGSPAELIGSLRADHVVELELESPLAPETLAVLDEVLAVGEENGTLRLTVRHPHRAVPLLLGELERRGAKLTRLATHHATLEDVFVELTGRHLRDS